MSGILVSVTNYTCDDCLVAIDGQVAYCTLHRLAGEMEHALNEILRRIDGDTTYPHLLLQEVRLEAATVLDRFDELEDEDGSL